MRTIVLSTLTLFGLYFGWFVIFVIVKTSSFSRDWLKICTPELNSPHTITRSSGWASVLMGLLVQKGLSASLPYKNKALHQVFEQEDQTPTCAHEPGVPGGLQQQVSSTWPWSRSLQMWLQWAAPTSTNGSAGDSCVGPATGETYHEAGKMGHCFSAKKSIATWQQCDAASMPSSKSSGPKGTSPRMLRFYVSLLILV